jgi:hypothetical protein
MPLRTPLDWEPYRRALGGEIGDRTCGCFMFPARGVAVMVGTGAGWEHASMSRRERTPSWEEMCWLRGQLWAAEDCVMQLHPPTSRYVNRHSYCLHLWRPIGMEIPQPPAWMVG